MSSKLLLVASAISLLTSVAHTDMGPKMAPGIAGLTFPNNHAPLNGWYQVSGYFILNAIQQARWAKYGIRTTYDKLLFWGLNGLYLAAGLGYARAGIVPPQIAFFSNIAVMVLSQFVV